MSFILALYRLLPDGRVVEEPSFLKWSIWMNETRKTIRMVAKHPIPTRAAVVITVFNGIIPLFTTNLHQLDPERDKIIKTIKSVNSNNQEEALENHHKFCKEQIQ